MDLLSLAKNVIGKMKGNAYEDMKGLLANSQSSQDKQREIMMKMIMGGVTSPSTSTNLVFGPHSTYQGESSMIPTTLDILDKFGNKVRTTKAYSSLKKALDIAKNYGMIPEGGQAWPRQIIDSAIKNSK